MSKAEIIPLPGNQQEPEESRKRRSRELHDDPLQLLSPDQAAGILCCSRSTIDRMVISGVLPHVPIRKGKRKRQYGIRRATLKKWIERNETKARDEVGDEKTKAIGKK